MEKRDCVCNIDTILLILSIKYSKMYLKIIYLCKKLP